jgi:hypothetical protein
LLLIQTAVNISSVWQSYKHSACQREETTPIHPFECTPLTLKYSLLLYRMIRELWTLLQEIDYLYLYD